MKLISIIVVIAALLILVSVFFMFKRGRMAYTSLVLWSIIWIGIALFFMFPNSLNSISSFFGMNNRMFFVFTVSIIVLFIFVFINYAMSKRLEMKLTKLVQSVSLLSSKVDELHDKSS